MRKGMIVWMINVEHNDYRADRVFGSWAFIYSSKPSIRRSSVILKPFLGRNGSANQWMIEVLVTFH